MKGLAMFDSPATATDSRLFSFLCQSIRLIDCCVDVKRIWTIVTKMPLKLIAYPSFNDSILQWSCICNEKEVFAHSCQIQNLTQPSAKKVIQMWKTCVILKWRSSSGAWTFLGVCSTPRLSTGLDFALFKRDFQMGFRSASQYFHALISAHFGLFMVWILMPSTTTSSCMSTHTHAPTHWDRPRACAHSCTHKVRLTLKTYQQVIQ